MKKKSDDNEYVLINGIEGKQLRVRKEMIDRLVTCRKALGMTQKDLADKMGVSRPNISRFESEDYNPTIDMIVKVADSMGYDVKIEFVERKSSTESRKRGS